MYMLNRRYIQYSNIAARVLREALRTELRADAAKRNESHVKFTPWANGRPARTYFVFFINGVFNSIKKNKHYLYTYIICT